MEKLTIENFLSIRRATIELKRINIFIGPQAKGKSLISKLIHFCKEVPSGIYETASEEKSKREFDKELRARFESIFPSYAWEKSEFSITYSCEQYGIKVSNEKINSKFKLCLKYTDKITKTLNAARKTFNKLASDDTETRLSMSRRNTINRELRETISSTLNLGSSESKIEQVMYIPAGRSFFANLQKSVFSFLSTSIPIDYFLKEFGAVYERTRDKNFLGFIDVHRPKHVSKLVNELICGNYLSDKGQDWILTDHGRVNVSNSSSGQQEVLPMAMVLSTWPFAPSNIFRRSFVIEEPEAHLFPIAQGQVASLIATAYNAQDRLGTFTITTHSPYILTAMNNLIQAGNVAASSQDLSKLYNIVPKDQIISFSDVAAYIVDKGTAKSIMDESLSLIDANAVDAVSQHFSEKFERLVELEIEASNSDQE